MYLVYTCMCLIFGTTFLAIKVGVDAGASPLFFAGSRFLLAGIIVLFALKFLHGDIGLKQIKRWDVVTVGLLKTGVLFGCLYWGEKYISSGIAALLSATTPMMIGIAEWFQGTRENTWIKGCGLLIAFCGVTVAVLPALGMDASQTALLAVGVILIAEVCDVFGTMTAKRVLAAGLSPHVLNGWQMVVGGSGLVAASLLIEPAGWSFRYDVLSAWAYLVVFGSLIGHGSYFWLVHRAGALLPSTWTYISPVIAQFVGYYVLNEYLSSYSFIGLALVFGGVFLVSRADYVRQTAALYFTKI